MHAEVEHVESGTVVKGEPVEILWKVEQGDWVWVEFPGDLVLYRMDGWELV